MRRRRTRFGAVGSPAQHGQHRSAGGRTQAILCGPPYESASGYTPKPLPVTHSGSMFLILSGYHEASALDPWSVLTSALQLSLGQ